MARMRFEPLLFYFSEHLARACRSEFLGKNYEWFGSFISGGNLLVKPHAKKNPKEFSFVSTRRYVKSFTTRRKRCYAFAIE